MSDPLWSPRSVTRVCPTESSSSCVMAPSGRMSSLLKRASFTPSNRSDGNLAIARTTSELAMSGVSLMCSRTTPSIRFSLAHDRTVSARGRRRQQNPRQLGRRHEFDDVALLASLGEDFLLGRVRDHPAFWQTGLETGDSGWRHLGVRDVE